MRESIIQSRIEELDSKICNDVCLEQKLKKELQEIHEEKGRGAIFRSKARSIENGEKPMKFFFNLERRNYEKTIISVTNRGRKILVRFQTSKQRNRKSLWPVLQNKN